MHKHYELKIQIMIDAFICMSPFKRQAHPIHVHTYVLFDEFEFDHLQMPLVVVRHLQQKKKDALTKKQREQQA